MGNHVLTGILMKDLCYCSIAFYSNDDIKNPIINLFLELAAVI